MPALGVRGGRAEHQRGAAQRREPLGNRARVVAGGGIRLLVGPLVGLVDHDQPEVRLRREDRRAGADDDVVRARGGRAPLVVALALAEAGVQHADAAGEALGEARDGRHGERDLGHEHDPALPLVDGVLQRGEVDLGLSAARDTHQQQRLALGKVDGVRDRARHLALLADEFGRRADGDLQVAQRIAAIELFRDLDQAVRAQQLEPLAGSRAELARQPAHGQRQLRLAREAFEQPRRRVLRARARPLADALRRLARPQRERDEALPVDLDEPVLDQRLDGRLAARDLRQLVDRNRPAGVEQRLDRPCAARGAAALDPLREAQRLLRRRGETHDLDDARASAGAAQLVAPLGKSAANERREGGLEGPYRDTARQRSAQPGGLARRLVEPFVELLLSLGERLRRIGGPTHDEGPRALPRAGRQHQRVRLPRRSEVLVRDPARQFELEGIERRGALDGRIEIADVAVVAAEAGRRLDDDALQRAFPERDVHHLARLDLAAGRHAVGEGHVCRAAGVNGDLHVAGAHRRGRLGGHAPNDTGGDGSGRARRSQAGG